MRAYIYTRVSSEKQKREGGGIKDQQRNCIKYCVQNDIEIAGMFRDEAVSGSVKPSERPGMSQILAQATKGDVIVADMLDRFSRHLFNQMELDNYCEKNGIRLVCASDPSMNGIDPGNDLVRLVKSWSAADERRKLRMRVTSSLRNKRSASKKYTRIPPYGFAFDGKEMVVSDAEADAVRVTIRLYNDGNNKNAVASMVASLGHKKRNGNPVDYSFVRRVVEKLDFYAEAFRDNKRKQI